MSEDQIQRMNLLLVVVVVAVVVLGLIEIGFTGGTLAHGLLISDPATIATNGLLLAINTFRLAV